MGHTMADDDQKKIKLPRTAKGKKPQYFADPTVDKLLSMVLTLMGELSVTRDRLDTVERLIENNGLFKVDDIERSPSSDAVCCILLQAVLGRSIRSAEWFGSQS